MSQFNAVNAPGSYFASQIALGAAEHLDVFAVFGLHADDFQLTLRGVRYHLRTVVMRHVFERGIPATAASSGPRIPTWTQVNVARDILISHGVDNFRAV